MKLYLKFIYFILIYVFNIFWTLPYLFTSEDHLKVFLGYILILALVVMLFRIPRLFINKSKKLKNEEIRNYCDSDINHCLSCCNRFFNEKL